MSRITWLKEGDANTSLFHSQARYRMRKNFIAKLQDDGTTMTSHEDKAQVLLNCFSNLISRREQRNTTINLEALGMQQQDLHLLDAPFSQEEVWNTIKLLPTDKAPGGFLRFAGLSSKKVSWLQFQQHGEEISETFGHLIRPMLPSCRRWKGFNMQKTLGR
jgi:lambda repressor-like predicted transcriptional regulator